MLAASMEASKRRLDCLQHSSVRLYLLVRPFVCFKHNLGRPVGHTSEVKTSANDKLDEMRLRRLDRAQLLLMLLLLLRNFIAGNLALN